jgi:peptidoglycan/LPS O-acetylase OafA/YrhL
MSRKFSAYLDIVRFLAALVVFLGHASAQSLTGGLFWQLAPYGDTCVVVFFVLSGLVVAYVVDTKDRTWQRYTSNRSARLWSVVLPALVLTAIVDLVGVRVAPAMYNGPWFYSDNLVIRFLASALMLQDVWHFFLVPGINAPFWSLTYEAFYYAVFGVLVFVKSSAKWIIGATILAVGGPLIAGLFPIWALGYVAYRLTKSVTLSAGFSYFMFFSGLALLLYSPSIRASLPYDLPIMGDPIAARYLDAFGFFLNLLGAHGIAESTLNLPENMRSFIATIAGATFTLYLFHRPLIQFFSYAGPDDSASWQRRVLVLGGTLLVTFMAVPLTEMLRKHIGESISRRLPGSGPRAIYPPPAAQVK